MHIYFDQLKKLFEHFTNTSLAGASAHTRHWFQQQPFFLLDFTIKMCSRTNCTVNEWISPLLDFDPSSHLIRQIINRSTENQQQEETMVFRTNIYIYIRRFLKICVYPLFSPKLRSFFSIETYGDLGIPPFSRPPADPSFGASSVACRAQSASFLAWSLLVGPCWHSKKLVTCGRYYDTV